MTILVNIEGVKMKRNKIIVEVLIVAVPILVLFSLVMYSSHSSRNEVINTFKNGKTIRCDNRLVSKDNGYVYDEENKLFVNNKDGYVFYHTKCVLMDESL